MNIDQEIQETNNANPKRPLYESHFCKMRQRGVIEFRPFGEQGDVYYIRLEEIDTPSKLQKHVGTLRQNCSSVVFPPDAIDDLAYFTAYVLNPRHKNIINTAFDRAEGIGLGHGKFCHETTDDGIEIRVGEHRHNLCPGIFNDCGSDLYYALEELRDKPWFTDEIKAELFTFAAGRGISYVIKYS
jgi:hypothetical protein